MSEFSLEQFTGGGDMTDKFVEATTKWMGENKSLAALVIVVCVLAVIYLIHLWYTGVIPVQKQKMSPTTTMRMVQQDSQAVGATAAESSRVPNYEFATAGPAPQSAVSGRSALAQQVLHSDYGCGESAGMSDKDAWAWMGDKLKGKEGMVTDDNLSQVMSGRANQV